MIRTSWLLQNSREIKSGVWVPALPIKPFLLQRIKDSYYVLIGTAQAIMEG